MCKTAQRFQLWTYIWEDINVHFVDCWLCDNYKKNLWNFKRLEKFIINISWLYLSGSWFEKVQLDKNGSFPHTTSAWCLLYNRVYVCVRACSSSYSREVVCKRMMRKAYGVYVLYVVSTSIWTWTCLASCVFFSAGLPSLPPHAPLPPLNLPGMAPIPSMPGVLPSTLPSTLPTMSSMSLPSDLVPHVTPATSSLTPNQTPALILDATPNAATVTETPAETPVITATSTHVHVATESS